MEKTTLVLIVGRWTARILALGLFFFWGAFFVEHIQEWFLHPAKGLPPVWVWFAMLAHLGILLGMLALWRWEIAGSLLAVASTLAFFGNIAIGEMRAGRRYSTFIVFIAVTVIPPLLALICHLALAWKASASAAP